MIDHITTNKIAYQSPHLSWIKDNTILLSLHGSRAYGTNVDGSDFDYKGVFVKPKEYYYGFSKNIDQAELKEPDTVIYSINKFFSLASQCNPNIIELLFCDANDIVYVNSFGEMILDNRDLFLSKKARYSFSGYAVSQLRKIKLHRAYLLNPPKSKPERSNFGLAEIHQMDINQLTAANSAVKTEMDRMNFNFLDSLDNAQKIEVKNACIDLLSEFKINHDQQYDAMARKIGFDDNVIEILQKERAYNSAKREWDNYNEWKLNRNVKRAADEAKFGIDCKHAYHLIRLLRMGKEILTEGKVIVKRPDREELLDIRNGAWSYEKIIEEAEKIEAEMNEAYDKSTLPISPNINQLNDLCNNIVGSFLR